MASDEVAGLFEVLPDRASPVRLGDGLPRLRCAERGQAEWRAFSLDELVPEEHRVRLAKCFARHLLQNLSIDMAPGYVAAWRMWPIPQPKDGMQLHLVRID